MLTPFQKIMQNRNTNKTTKTLFAIGINLSGLSQEDIDSVERIAKWRAEHDAPNGDYKFPNPFRVESKRRPLWQAAYDKRLKELRGK